MEVSRDAIAAGMRYAPGRKKPETVVDRSKLLIVAIAALVVLALVTIIVSQEPGPIDPDNPPPLTQPTAP